MRRYDTIFIIDPDLSEDQWDSVLGRVAELVSQLEGLLVAFDKWGTRKLAYEIKKKVRGYYVRLDYCGQGHLVDEIERFFRIDERVLKYMTILTEETVDVDKVKEEIAQAELAKESAAQETEKAAEQNLKVKEEIAQAELAKEPPAQETEKAAEQNLSEVSQPETAETETDPTEDNREA